MFLCCNARARRVNKLLTPTRHNRNCPRVRMTSGPLQALFSNAGVLYYLYLLYLHCCFLLHLLHFSISGYNVYMEVILSYAYQLSCRIFSNNEERLYQLLGDQTIDQADCAVVKSC